METVKSTLNSWNHLSLYLLFFSFSIFFFWFFYFWNRMMECKFDRNYFQEFVNFHIHRIFMSTFTALFPKTASHFLLSLSILWYPLFKNHSTIWPSLKLCVIDKWNLIENSVYLWFTCCFFFSFNSLSINSYMPILKRRINCLKIRRIQPIRVFSIQPIYSLNWRAFLLLSSEFMEHIHFDTCDLITSKTFLSVFFYKYFLHISNENLRLTSIFKN